MELGTGTIPEMTAYWLGSIETMTREEAIVLFEKILVGAKEGLERHPEEGKRVYGMRKELAEIALAALRYVSREELK